MAVVGECSGGGGGGAWTAPGSPPPCKRARKQCANSHNKNNNNNNTPQQHQQQQISITFKNQEVLKNCTWEVKKGERVGLVGVNGAGKTTQLQIVLGKLQPDAGEIIKAKRNMKIAYLAQEFDVDPTRTVREEFYSVYDKQRAVLAEQEAISAQLEAVGSDMDAMQALLDRLDKLNSQVRVGGCGGVWACVGVWVCVG